MKQPSFFSNRRLVIFFPVALTAALLALVWMALRLVLTAPALPLTFKLTALFIAAVACLGIGLGGLWSFVRVRKGMDLVPVSLWAAIAVVYLAPLLALLLPEWLSRWQTAPAAALHIFFTPTLSTGSIWVFVYLYQAFLLGIFALRGRTALPQPVQTPRPPLSLFWQVTFALCASAAIWLIGQYLIQLFLPLLNLPPLGAAAAPPLLKGFVAAAAVLVAPWTAGRFFFFQLRSRLRPNQALVLALLFAILQFRPIVAIPAFLFALCAREIALRTGRLTPVAAAYALFNLLTLLFNWNLVI